ncbi:MAG TPA: HD domain-containing phosphohydrolase [Anaeromyxobacteraceae bacterium]|nr:HD domain-containing phosphohydrolase [Anaeromyxobacteraceae bacterium]
MLERFTLPRDLICCDGTVLAPAGAVVTLASIGEAAANAPPLPARPLSDTFAAGELSETLTNPAHRHLFRGAQVQGAVARVLLSTALPAPLWAELAALRDADPARWRHAMATACVAVRMQLGVTDDPAALWDAAAAGLLHDLGMRHVPERAGRIGEELARGEAEAIATHPLLGALHVASVLGEHPAVEAALAHHWRRGRGYPRLDREPSPLSEVVAVASAFVALTQPRVFRSSAYEARGAADLLIREASHGRADLEAVRRLVHALRGGRGDLAALRFGRERIGQAPAVNRHRWLDAEPAA